MIDGEQFLGLMAGVPILMRTGMAEALELLDVRKRLTLVVDTVVRDENGNEKNVNKKQRDYYHARERSREFCYRLLYRIDMTA